jgi:hypothetical protein
VHGEALSPPLLLRGVYEQVLAMEGQRVRVFADDKLAGEREVRIVEVSCSPCRFDYSPYEVYRPEVSHTIGAPAHTGAQGACVAARRQP